MERHFHQIKSKAVQVHFECVCGLNVVDTEYFPIRWRDFSLAKIRRKIDRLTGKPFLSQHIVATACNCYEE